MRFVAWSKAQTLPKNIDNHRKRVFTLLTFTLVSYSISAQIGGDYFVIVSDGVETGKLVISEDEKTFSYDWNEHLTNGYTKGIVKKKGNDFLLQSYYDTLKTLSPVIRREKYDNNNLVTIEFFTIDSTPMEEVLFYFTDTDKKKFGKTDTTGYYSNYNLSGEIEVLDNPLFLGVKFKVDYNEANHYTVFLLPNVNSITYKYFKNEEFKVRRKGKILKSLRRKFVLKKAKKTGEMRTLTLKH